MTEKNEFPRGGLEGFFTAFKLIVAVLFGVIFLSIIISTLVQKNWEQVKAIFNSIPQAMVGAFLVLLFVYVLLHYAKAKREKKPVKEANEAMSSSRVLRGIWIFLLFFCILSFFTIRCFEKEIAAIFITTAVLVKTYKVISFVFFLSIIYAIVIALKMRRDEKEKEREINLANKILTNSGEPPLYE